MFFYIKKAKMQDAKKEVEDLNLSSEQRLQIEHDVKEMIGDQIDEDKSVVLDIESVRVIQPGKYELDLVQLFKGEPIVYRLEEGKYVIDIVKSFEAINRKRKIKQ